jgi:opacity protein-like surface antigen
VKVIVLFVTLVCSVNAVAQTTYPPQYRKWEVTGFGGGSFLGDFQFATPVSGSEEETSRTVGMHYARGYQTGLRIVENVEDFWSVDLEYSYANQPLRFTNISPGVESLSLSHSVHHFTYNVSFLPMSPRKRLRPYAKVGAGPTLFYIPGRSRDDARAKGVSLRDSWELAFNWGGGVKYLVYDQVAIGFDLRDQISGVPSYGLPRSAQVIDGAFVPGISRNGFVHNWQLNFGVTFQWDND